jgi:hypothetical protein
MTIRKPGGDEIRRALCDENSLAGDGLPQPSDGRRANKRGTAHVVPSTHHTWLGGEGVADAVRHLGWNVVARQPVAAAKNLCIGPFAPRTSCLHWQHSRQSLPRQ